MNEQQKLSLSLSKRLHCSACGCVSAEQERGRGEEAGAGAIRDTICPHETLPDEIRHAHCHTRTGGLL